MTALIILSTTLPCFSPKTRVVKDEVSEVEVEDETDGDDGDDDDDDDVWTELEVLPPHFAAKLRRSQRAGTAITTTASKSVFARILNASCAYRVTKKLRRERDMRRVKRRVRIK